MQLVIELGTTCFEALETDSFCWFDEFEERKMRLRKLTLPRGRKIRGVRCKALLSGVILGCIVMSAEAWSGADRKAFGLDQMSTEDKDFVIQVRGDRVSVKLRGVPLAEVLDRIARQCQIRTLLYGATDEKVSMEFNDLPLDRGLRWIIKDHDFILFYGEGKAGPGQSSRPRLEEVRVYARSQAMTRQLLGEAPKNPDPSVRKGEPEGVAAIDDEERITEVLKEALKGNRDEVWESALSALRDVDPTQARPLDLLVEQLAVETDHHLEHLLGEMLGPVDDPAVRWNPGQPTEPGSDDEKNHDHQN